MTDEKSSAPETRGVPALLYGFGGLIAAFSVAAVLGLALHKKTAEAEEGNARQQEVSAGPRLKVIPVAVAPAEHDVTLPGEVHAFQQATLYAKVSGYLKEIKVDKGDRVKRGQVLATIESPETEQQLEAANADLEVKRLAQQRARSLIKAAVVSQQELEQADGAVKVAEATVARMKALMDYEVIRAPFDGVVTARYADLGALLPAATGSTQNAQPVVDVADLDRLRIFVYLGQDDAASVEGGDSATVMIDARPAEAPIQADVSRLSRALDPRTRTMLTEIDLMNPPVRIYPGEFVHVRLRMKGRALPEVPVEALISQGDKTYVAEVRDKKAHLIQVTPGRDDGKRVQILSGLKGGESIALNASGEVSEGAPVQAIE
jgi:RND family efflux transporter MFP subunit